MQTAKREGMWGGGGGRCLRCQTKVRTEEGLTAGSGSLEVTSDLD